MIFNSFPFICFFSVFFLLYWFVFKDIKKQNLLILISNYVFYAWWDWRFLSLLAVNSIITFFLGIYIEKNTNEKHRKLLLLLGIVLGLGGLAFFKYFNFFVSSLVDLFTVFNISLSFHSLKLILPLGISFYTFRTISYLIDVDKCKIKPTTDWIAFFAYVAFFPSLISGPIDKAKLLVPQLERKRVFDYDQAVDGARQILWGLFKKIVVANNCALYSDQIFRDFNALPASSLVVGVFFYTFQIYADFSGYSDMAIGIARLMGFSITRNFDNPFFAQNISDYWHRWHISLTAWLTEYVFTPLSISFRDLGKFGLILAIVINFTLCGIWHGANWTYLLFGFMHGCYFIPIILKGTMNKKRRIAANRLFPTLGESWNMLKTFALVMLTFVVFRADNLAHAIGYYRHMLDLSIFSLPIFNGRPQALIALLFIFLMLFVEMVQRDKQHALQLQGIKIPRVVRWGLYYAIIILIVWFKGDQQGFIYFQF